MDKKGFLCFVFNTFMYFILFGILLLLILFLVNSLVAKIVLISASLFLCGFVEQWLVSRFVNHFVEDIIFAKKG